MSTQEEPKQSLKVHYLSNVGLEVRNATFQHPMIDIEGPGELYRIRLYNPYWWVAWILLPLWILAYPVSLAAGFMTSVGIIHLYRHLAGVDLPAGMGIPLGILSALISIVLWLLLSVAKDGIPSPRRYNYHYEYRTEPDNQRL